MGTGMNEKYDFLDNMEDSNEVMKITDLILESPLISLFDYLVKQDV